MEDNIFNNKPRNQSSDFVTTGAYKLTIALRQAQLSEQRVKREADGWREVNRELIPNEIAQLPARESGKGNRSAAVWVQYFHGVVGGFVVGKGCYFFADRRWMARYQPEELGAGVNTVDAVAWAPIQLGMKPWDGLIIPSHMGNLKQWATR